MNTQRIKRVLLGLGPLAAGLLLGLAGCQAGGELAAKATQDAASSAGSLDCQNNGELAFETLEQAAFPVGPDVYPPDRIRFFVFTDADQIDIGQWISSDAQASLAGLDYDRYLAVAIYQGWKRTNDYRVEIQRIVREGSTVYIYVYFIEPYNDDGPRETSVAPYQLVRVERGDLQGDIEFRLSIYVVEVIQQMEILP